MKTKVFMARTGELVLAHPVCFLKDALETTTGDFCILFGVFSGYVMESPQASNLNYYMSRKCEEVFEDLGEF